ncbi:MAG: NifB/NifX family molybdenum-iron cluster-binding protein [Spirochaetales bacterium]|nr:NifB/NifX family molybdenum-iron cluster-binding protein [Spirochaetales bacterium]
MKDGRIAVPSDGEGGMDGIRSGHFGHCDVFTIIELKDGRVENVSILPNQEHSQGGCLVPVTLLADNRVNAIIAGGMGLRPLMGFNAAGIDVYFDNQHAQVRSVIDELMNGNLEKMSEQMVCGGH